MIKINKTNTYFERTKILTRRPSYHSNTRYINHIIDWDSVNILNKTLEDLLDK